MYKEKKHSQLKQNTCTLENQEQTVQCEHYKNLKPLPTLTQIQKTALYHSGLSDSCTRAIEFLFNDQGARTDSISAACAIGNVSDCFIGLKGANSDKLHNLGLKVTCVRIRAKNRFNRKTCIGTWWLEIVDDNLWKQAQHLAASHIEHSIKSTTISMGAVKF